MYLSISLSLNLSIPFLRQKSSFLQIQLQFYPTRPTSDTNTVLSDPSYLRYRYISIRPVLPQIQIQFYPTRTTSDTYSSIWPVLPQIKIQFYPTRPTSDTDTFLSDPSYLRYRYSSIQPVTPQIHTVLSDPSYHR